MFPSPKSARLSHFIFSAAQNHMKFPKLQHILATAADMLLRFPSASRLDAAMYVLVVFFWVGLSASSISAANKSLSLMLTQNITATNAQ